MTTLYWFGGCATLVLCVLLFRRRYPGRRRWLVAGVVTGLVALVVWPVALWVVLALWATGFGRSTRDGRPPVRLPKKAVIPTATVGSIATLVAMGVGAGPPTPTSESAPLASTIAAASDVPTESTTSSPTSTTAPPSTFVQTVPPPLVTTPTPGPRPAPKPRPQPKPNPQPSPNPKPRPDPDRGREPAPERDPAPDDASGSSDDPGNSADGGGDSSGAGGGGSRPRTGHGGHPCGPGERDGDRDGYCGE